MGVDHTCSASAYLGRYLNSTKNLIFGPESSQVPAELSLYSPRSVSGFKSTNINIGNDLLL